MTLINKGVACTRSWHAPGDDQTNKAVACTGRWHAPGEGMHQTTLALLTHEWKNKAVACSRWWCVPPLTHVHSTAGWVWPETAAGAGPPAAACPLTPRPVRSHQSPRNASGDSRTSNETGPDRNTLDILQHTTWHPHLYQGWGMIKLNWNRHTHTF